MKKHTPVLVKEMLEGLGVQKGRRYIDATFGLGGHSREILRRGGMVLGIDADPQTQAVHGNFRDIEEIAKKHGFNNVDGILFDLGVSSYQLDTPERGFSFRYPNAALDLRMDQQHGEPASEIVNKRSEEDLYEIFATFGEEKLARAIAALIVRARRVRPLTTVGDVTGVVGETVKSPKELTPTLARVFQALRIAVNDELGALKEGLQGAERLLTGGGRLAVLSYHSLEDRIVKREIGRLGLRAVNKRPIQPSREEQQKNPRSRSAKLRIAEKL